MSEPMYSDKGRKGPRGVRGPSGEKGDQGEPGKDGQNGFPSEEQYNDILARLDALDNTDE